MTRSVPGSCCRGRSLAEKGSSCTGRCMLSARAASRALSPMATSSASQARMAAASVTSGPIPAGSPVVMAILGIAIARGLLDIDERFVADLAQPGVQLFLVLAVVQVVHRLGLDGFIAHIFVPAPLYLEDVPAELCAYRLGNLPLGSLRHAGFKLGHHLSGVGPAEIAALRRRTDILGVLSGECAEILAGESSLA